VGGEQSLRITLAPTFTGHALAPQSSKGAAVNPQAHALVAAVLDRACRAPSAGVGAWGVGETCLLWTVSVGERAAPASTAAAGIPGVVLCVADGIVRIVVRAGDDSGGRPRREIDPLIGVAAGEEKRRDRGAPICRCSR
jgi:hypothetical protein